MSQPSIDPAELAHPYNFYANPLAIVEYFNPVGTVPIEVPINCQTLYHKVLYKCGVILEPSLLSDGIFGSPDFLDVGFDSRRKQPESAEVGDAIMLYRRRNRSMLHPVWLHIAPVISVEGDKITVMQADFKTETAYDINLKNVIAMSRYLAVCGIKRQLDLAA